MVSYSSKYDYETVKNLTEMESNCDGVAINLEFQPLTKVQVTYGIYTPHTCVDMCWPNMRQRLLQLLCYAYNASHSIHCHNTLHFNDVTNLQLNWYLKQYISWNSGFWKWTFSCISEDVEYVQGIIQFLNWCSFGQSKHAYLLKLYVLAKYIAKNIKHTMHVALSLGDSTPFKETLGMIVSIFLLSWLLNINIEMKPVGSYIFRMGKAFPRINNSQHIQKDNR